MSLLDEEWIWSSDEDDCPQEHDGAPLKLGLTNLEGIFLLLVAGIVCGTGLVIVEMAYDRFCREKLARGNCEDVASQNLHRNEEFSKQAVS